MYFHQYSFYRSAESGRLSRPRHCSKGAQPVPKAAVYGSGCCDKHKAAVGFDPGTQHTAVERLTTRPLLRLVRVSSYSDKFDILLPEFLAPALRSYLFTGSASTTALLTSSALLTLRLVFSIPERSRQGTGSLKRPILCQVGR